MSKRAWTWLLSLSLFLLFAASVEAAPAKKVPTPRGESIEVLAEYPTGAGKAPLPAVILAPGTSYTMRLPILEGLARALLKQGFVVYRFDWAYFVKDGEKGTPSKDRGPEVEDLTTVLELVRHDPAVDKARIALAGKSLGSLIAWRVLRAQPDVRGALLLTPVCSSSPTKTVVPEVNYPDVQKETRPTAWLLGDSDAVCVPATLYRFLGTSPGPIRIAVVGGNHSFEDGPPKDKSEKPDKAAVAQTSRTLELVTRLSLDFLGKVLISPPAAAL